jgi:selenoprotein W-related protein
LKKHRTRIASFELVPSGGGVFEFFIDQELVYSKKATGLHPEAEYLVRAVGEKL